MKQKEIIEKIKEYFSGKIDIAIAIIYGSVTGKDFSSHSDVDIAISSKTAISFEDILIMNSELQLILERDVDLVDISKTEGLLHYKIFTKGIFIKGPSLLLTGHLIKALDFYEDFLPQLNEMRRRRIKRFIYGA